MTYGEWLKSKKIEHSEKSFIVWLGGWDKMTYGKWLVANQLEDCYKSFIIWLMYAAIAKS